MKRREFISLIGGAAAAWPLSARAQQPAMPVIGFLGGPSRSTYAENIAAIHNGLKQSGYVEGQNLAVEHRWAEGQYDQLPALAADLVNRRVNVIITLGGATVYNVQNGTPDQARSAHMMLNSTER